MECTNCHRKGHTRRHCTATREKQGEALQILNSANDTILKFLKGVTINDNKFKAFIDTGSSDCTIRKSAVFNSNFKTEKVTTELKSFRPEDFKVISTEIINADISVDGVMVKNIPICVVPDNFQAMYIIIGRKYTEIPKVEYRKKENSFTFYEDQENFASDIDVDTLSESVIICTEELNLPPHSVNFINAIDSTGKHPSLVLNLMDKSTTINKESPITYEELRESPTAIPESLLRSPIKKEEIDVREEALEEEVEDLVKLLNDNRECF